MHKNFSFLKAGQIDVGIIRRCRVSGIVLLPCLDSEGKICKVYNLKKTYSVLPLDVVLMAGGRGERLRPLTDSVPKPLLKIGDKTIIDYNIERLLDCGIENLYVTVNYLAEQLEEHFKDKRGNVKIRCVRAVSYTHLLNSPAFKIFSAISITASSLTTRLLVTSPPATSSRIRGTMDMIS